ncbi:hypothetical protein Q1695_011579 [Nippostrongylus brasiliensis]|nr:hypothetical protein Q1695_011579 [Nippostrongylus brasiliensis]
MPRWLTEGPSVDTITCPVVLYASAPRRVVDVSAPPQPVQGILYPIPGLGGLHPSSTDHAIHVSDTGAKQPASIRLWSDRRHTPLCHCG